MSEAGSSALCVYNMVSSVLYGLSPFGDILVPKCVGQAYFLLISRTLRGERGI